MADEIVKKQVTVEKEYNLTLLRKQKQDFLEFYAEQKANLDEYVALLDKSKLSEEEKEKVRELAEPFVDENLPVEAARIDKIIKEAENNEV